MRVLVVGVGTVGEAIARISADADWCESMILADYDESRARTLSDSLGDPDRFPAIRLDARDAGAVAEAARAHRADLVMNAVDPQFVMPIFRGALDADAHYMDMACSLSKPHPERPFELPGLKLGDEQFAMDDAWKAKGKLALVGMGMDPGLTDVFAAHAAKHDFDEVHETHVRDGGDLEIPGHAFAPVFSIWTTIEECLNPPIIWADGDWHTTEPFSAPENFPFPEGIGPIECVNVEHEEVLLVPRWIETRRVTFKYALGSDFIDKLKTIHALGMDRTDPVRVRGVEVAPRDVLAAITPDPITLGDKFRGRAVVGTWTIGIKDGRRRETFAYQMADAEEVWRRTGLQVVGWQTGFNPTIAMELLATNAWSGAGVLGPEAFDPDPYLALLDLHGIHRAIVDMDPGAHRPT
ncbi:MAG TPA: saccharopine dehydrogenase C-terminal domain-containing protein [Candidatus Limnocylindrales bacterium]|nr:saccharopine dehydrogenase C-terminal domain-containing protein [Candidatus Limnocylindrales bacterium]